MADRDSCTSLDWCSKLKYLTLAWFSFLLLALTLLAFSSKGSVCLAGLQREEMGELKDGEHAIVLSVSDLRGGWLGRRNSWTDGSTCGDLSVEYSTCSSHLYMRTARMYPGWLSSRW